MTGKMPGADGVPTDGLTLPLELDAGDLWDLPSRHGANIRYP